MPGYTLDQLAQRFKTRQEQEKAQGLKPQGLTAQDMLDIEDTLAQQDGRFHSDAVKTEESSLDQVNDSMNRMKQGDISKFNHLPGFLREYYGKKVIEEQFGQGFEFPPLNDELRTKLNEMTTRPEFRYTITQMINRGEKDQNGNDISDRLMEYDQYMNSRMLAETMNPVSEERKQNIRNKFPGEQGEKLIAENQEKQVFLAKTMFMTQLGRMDIHNEDGSNLPYSGTAADLYAHGSRVAFTLPTGSKEQQTKMYDSWQKSALDNGAVWKGRFASHEMHRRQVDKDGNIVPFEEIRIRWKKQLKNFQLNKKITTYVGNYGMNIPLGGLGKPFNGKDCIDAQGTFGHTYMRTRKGDEKHCGAILFGFENAAPKATSCIGQLHNFKALSHDMSSFFSDKTTVGKPIGGREADLSHLSPEEFTEAMNTFEAGYRRLQERAAQDPEAARQLEQLNEVMCGKRMDAAQLSGLLISFGMEKEKAEKLVDSARTEKDANYTKPIEKEDAHKFPSYAERQALMEQLEKLDQDGIAPASKEIYKDYIGKLKKLNDLEEQYLQIDEKFGMPPTIEEKDKEKLLQAMNEVAVAGETFLADAQRKEANMKAGIPAVVANLQGLLSKDHEMLNIYEPNKSPMSFPEIQQNARTQVVDFRGKEIGIMTNKLSGRIPMTVVGADGKRRRGVFTKASYVNVKKDFEEMIDRATQYYDKPEVRNAMAPYKTALMRQGAFPGKKPEEVTTDMVAEKLKEPVRNILPKYREYLKKEGTKLYGQDPMEASDEKVIGFLYNEVMQDKDPKVTLEKIGVDIMQQPEEIADVLQDGIKRGVKEKLSDTVNARDLGLRDGDRVDHRNSAMSAMAGLIGMNNHCARSVNMKYLNEEGEEVEGTFMEFADGLDLMGKGGEKLFTHVCDEPFGSPCKANRSLADLQVLDYLSGNVDRHGGNMTYKVDKQGKIADVVAFDNDTSFGVQPIDKDKGTFRLGGVNQLKVISGPMARKISNISPEMLKFTLRGRGLSEQEIESSCQRLDELKKAIAKGKQAKTAEEIEAAGKQLCIVEPKDLEQIPFDTLAQGKHTLFQNVKQYMDVYMKKAREKYPYDPNAEMPQAKQFEEVSTMDRKYAAGGIGASMDDMSRMLKNEVTGFEVSGLSRFLRSSGKWRSMISAVENAEKISKQVKQEIGKELEGVSRDDPRVKAQLEKADKAMARVKKANDEYLARKMKEKGVKTPEELVGRGKSTYEQKRIDYALKLRKSVQKYEAINKPVTKEQKAEKEAVMGSLKYADARKKKQGPKQPGLS